MKEIVKEYLEQHPEPQKAVKLAEILADGFSELQHHDDAIFHRIKMEAHELYNGSHYDEMFAKYAVARMYHTGLDGKKHEGEYWSIGQVKQFLSDYPGKIKDTNTYWDVYVAFNANYHDKCNLFKKWFPENHEQKIIEDAIIFYFMDEDAPDGKVWLYQNSLK